MTKKDRDRWDRLVGACVGYLADNPHGLPRQYADLWRGDMRAVLAADSEINRLRAALAKATGEGR